MDNKDTKSVKLVSKKWLSSAIIVLAATCIAGCGSEGIQSPDTTLPSETSALVETTTVPTEVSEHAIIDKFIELYNASSANPVADLAKMDIQGEDYRTEFRLNSFKGAVGQKGVISEGTIEVVNYGVWGNDSIRIYARVESHDSAVALVYDIVHILDASVTDDQIEEDISTEHSILLGERNQINGYINTDYADGGIVGYDVMIDCGNLDFMK